MIISHRHRFIFLHCRKAAGSSIAGCLSPALGADDLHLGTWPEALQQGVFPNRRAWKDLAHPVAASSFLVRLLRRPTGVFDASVRVAALNGAQRLKYRRVLGHSPEHAYAERVRAFVDADVWNSYFKFCFVRNPYERAVSDYRWRRRKSGNRTMTFLEFLEALDRSDFRSRVIPRHFDNWPIYTIDDRIEVDFVGRFENLERDMTEVLRVLGIDGALLPHEKKSEQSADRRPGYREMYGRKERRLVEKLFRKELDCFDYEF